MKGISNENLFCFFPLKWAETCRSEGQQQHSYEFSASEFLGRRIDDEFPFIQWFMMLKDWRERSHTHGTGEETQEFQKVYVCK